MFQRVWLKIISGLCFLLLAKGHGTENVLNDTPPNKTKGKELLLDEDKKTCWMTMNAGQHFKIMEQLEESYSKIQEQYENEISHQTKRFDNETLETMLKTRGRLEGKGVAMDQIPAGLNLGGSSMLKHEKSLLFFHRMKLRNSTKFRINVLHTDLGRMLLTAQLSLHDLHLLGSYERAFHDKYPYNLYYVPSYGLLEILLKDVVCVVQGQLKFLHDSPYIVLINSELDVGDAMLLHKNNASSYDKPLSIRQSHIEDFMDRMKSDLDSWLKDFFNHYLLFYKPNARTSEKYREFQKKRTIVLNEYVENALTSLKHKIHQLNASAVQLPKFNIFTVNGMKIQLMDGVLRGLDSIYRRSIATGATMEEKIRKVDAIVGFSNLKVIYKYTTHLTTGIPPLSGLLILSADELTAHMSLSLLKDPENADLTFHSIQELKEKSLTVEGAANKIISNFKHILEIHIWSIMSNLLVQNIRSLSTLTKCVPPVFGVDDLDNISEGESTTEKNDSLDDEEHSGANNTDDFTTQENIIIHEESDSQNYNKSPESQRSDESNSRASDEPSYSNDNKTINDTDYVLNKEDSIELEVPSNANTGKSKYHFLAKESLAIKKLN